MPATPVKRLQELEREAVAKGQLYHTLLRRQQEIRNQQETVSPDAYVLSLATTPYRPSSPNPILFIFPSLVVFLIGGSLLAVILEKLDRGLRSEARGQRGARRSLHRPCAARCEHRHNAPTASASIGKSVRGLCGGISFDHGNHATGVQNAPAESHSDHLQPARRRKDHTGSESSASIALLQQRVLLIDLGLKHPSVQRELNGKTEHGIIGVLLKNLVPAQVIQRVPELGLDYLPASRCFFDPLILFAGDEMRRLLHELRGSYDCIIIDSSPVLGSTETRLLAAMADEILFVVKWGSTRRDIAKNALNLLRSGSGPATQQLQSVSAVITQVDLEEHGALRIRRCRRIFPALSEIFVPIRRGRTADCGSRTADFNGAFGHLEPCRKAGCEGRGWSRRPQAVKHRGLAMMGNAAFQQDPGTIVRLPFDSPTLPLLAATLGDFHRQAISYCYWKSGKRIQSVLAGEGGSRPPRGTRRSAPRPGDPDRTRLQTLSFRRAAGPSLDPELSRLSTSRAAGWFMFICICG